MITLVQWVIIEMPTVSSEEWDLVCVGRLLKIVLRKLCNQSRLERAFKFLLFLGIVGAIGYVCVTANVDWSNYKERFANIKETAQEAKEWVQQHGEKLHVILETALESDD